VDTFLTSRIITDILVGLTNGVIYGLVALSLVLVWRSTGILNFAQGAMPMFATYIGMIVFANDLSYWPLVAISIVAGFTLGGVTERLLVRHLYGKPEINPIVAAAIWSTTPRGIPNPFSPIDWQLAGRPFALSPFSVYEITTALAVLTLVAVLFRFTKLGLQLRASALAPEVSRLLGVRVSRMLTLGWILSIGVGTVCAILVASNFFTGLTPQVMDGIFAFGFIAAAVGGLDSPVGAVVAGVSLGIILQFVGDYVSSNAIILTALIVLIVSLMVRPSGLFAKSSVRRV
jgi:branched-chain amino acid transport system permease protein